MCTICKLWTCCHEVQPGAEAKKSAELHVFSEFVP